MLGIYYIQIIFLRGIYQVYLCKIEFQVYAMYRLCIYLIYYCYIPGGWCCGGGQGPIPPDQPAIVSPGLVMTLILSLPSLRHRGFLLLDMWIQRARLVLKIEFTFRSWQALQTKRSSTTGMAASFMVSRIMATIKLHRIMGRNAETRLCLVIRGIYQVYTFKIPATGPGVDTW